MDFGPIVLNPAPRREGDCPVCGAWLVSSEFPKPTSPELQAQLIEEIGEEKAKIKYPSAFRDSVIVRVECKECGEVREFVK